MQHLDNQKSYAFFLQCDQHVLCEGDDAGGDAEERPEGGVTGAAPGGSEGELIGVALMMLVSLALVGDQGPALEVGELLMRPGQDGCEQ